MPRWLTCALVALTLLTLPAFVVSAWSAAAPVETFYGMLLSVSATELTLDTGDDRPIHAQINGATKYLSTMGKVKASDFEPGDKVTVEATHADGDHFVAATITLNKKGSAEDKQNARSKLSPPPTPAVNEPSVADRPRLNRASSGGDVSSDSVPARTDSGPPALRRSSPDTQPTPAPSAPQATPAQRPSLSAEDVNGVTRTPANPPLPASGSDGSVRGSAGDDSVIDQTREVAATFTQTLPNYVVKQFTTRYVSQAARRCEFASSLNALLSPYSATEFRNKRAVTIVNRQAYKYDYTIDQPRSAWRVETEGQSYQPGYDGSIWIDKETFRVLRIEMAARNMPRSFPIDTTESSLDYDFVLIGEQKYLLPVHSESLSCWLGTSQCSRNVIEFRNYKKYSADSSITFDPAPTNK